MFPMTEQLELTHALVDDCLHELYGQHGAFERPKESAQEMQAIAMALGFARLFGLNGLPTQEQFLGGYYTTLGPFVYVPAVERQLDPLERLSVRLHELQHVVDWYKDPLGFPPKYLALFINADGGQLEPRAVYESSAMAVAQHVRWLFKGTVPASLNELGHELSHGYALHAPEVALGRSLLEQDATALANGLHPTMLGRKARDFFLQRAPQCLHERAR